MSEYVISNVSFSDRRVMEQVDQLLKEEGIRRDGNLDYTCVMYDEDYHVIATGSCFANTLRCLAVRGDHQGEGLLNEIVTHLVEVQFERGNYHLFLYTKVKTAALFRDLGFYEIARVDGQLVFMENRKNGFPDYLKKLALDKKDGTSAAVIMNANPFTTGHQYLVERAAAVYDHVHVFVLSEDVSLVPFKVRKRLVEQGISHLSNVICHESGPYMISNATFPSYFLKDEKDVIRAHAKLDLAVFEKIAGVLGITARFVGEEPTSVVTGIYNELMTELLPEKGILCTVVPRKQADGKTVSASMVRRMIEKDEWDLIRTMVPGTTWEYLKSDKAEGLIQSIKKSSVIEHY